MCNLIIIKLIAKSLLPPFGSLLAGLIGGDLLMCGTLAEPGRCDVRVDLSIALCSLEVNTLLLCILLEAGSLPLGQPSLGIGLRTRILRIETFRILDLSLPFAGRHEYFSTALGLLNNIFSLLLLAFFGHSILNQTLKVVIFIGFILAG